MRFFLASCIISIIAIIAVNFPPCANYEFFSERAELLYTNDSFVRNVNFHFGKVNRSYSALNASFEVIRDFNDQKLLSSLKCFQFYHNEYRFTGTHITADTCKIEKANIFSLQKQFNDAGLFISLCHIKKGSYKLINFAPQAKYFPQYLPPGKIRVNARLHDGHGSDLFSVNWDYEVRSPRSDEY